MKKKQRGGKRLGAGRKFTGVNTVGINFCVHKDYVDLIKDMVYSKLKELKEGKGIISLAEPMVQEINKADLKIQTMIAKELPKKRTINNDAVSDYLKSRRSKKLGLK